MFNYLNGFIGEYLCKLCIGGNFMWIGGVVLVVLLIGVVFERYFVVLYFYDENCCILKKKFKFIILVCWLFFICWNFFLFLFVKYDVSLDFCYEDWFFGWYMNVYSLGWFIMIGILLVIIMFVLYS